MPKVGIYAVKVRILNEKNIFKGVAYLGSRPTFGGKQDFKTSWIIGNILKMFIKPKFITATNVVKPKITPNIWGIVFVIPKLNAE